MHTNAALPTILALMTENGNFFVRVGNKGKYLYFYIIRGTLKIVVTNEEGRMITHNDFAFAKSVLKMREVPSFENYKNHRQKVLNYYNENLPILLAQKASLTEAVKVD